MLQRLEDTGLKVNKEKCVFFQKSITYLGHRIDQYGLHLLDDGIEAVVNVPAPKDVSQLRSFLGLMTHYGKFLRNLSTVVAPLNRLLGKGVKWIWSTEEQNAFEAAKQLLLDSPALVHFDPQRKLYLQCDASSVGLGVVLSHRIDGTDRPVAFASKTLSIAQKGYSQLEKEGLAIIFGLTRFHQFLYGRKFVIVTDHKPLLGLLGEQKGLPVHAAARIVRWAIRLQTYDYELQFRPTTEHSNCDLFSRLPLEGHFINVEPIGALLAEVDGSMITAAEVAKFSRKDVLFAQVISCILSSGWSS